MLSVVLTLALAQPANPYLDTARSLVRELRFAEAVTQLEVARQVPDLRDAQRLEILELLARCHVAEGHRAEAEEAIAGLLAIAPEHELDRTTTSPKIITLFDEVKARLFPNQQVSLVEEPAAPGRVRVRVVDPFRRVKSLELQTRLGDGPWSARPVEPEGRVIDLPTPGSASDVMSWFLSARDDADAVVASVGTSAEPRVTQRLSPAPPVEPQPEASGGGAKVAGGVLVAVAVVSVGVATALQVNARALDAAARDPSKPPGDWADTARATHANAVTQNGVSVGLFVAGGAAAITATVLFAW